MFRAWLELSLESARLWHEAQEVIGLRLLKLASGGASSQAEAELMLMEKGVALAEALGVLAAGGSMQHVLRRYRSLVRANKLRLSA